MGGPEMPPQTPQCSDTPRGTRGAPRSAYSQLGELGVGRRADRIPAGHLVVRLARREELVGIDAGALDGAIADALVQPLRQHVVGRREALAIVEHARQRIVALADLHQLVARHVPARDRVDVSDHRVELQRVERRADEIAHADGVVSSPHLLLDPMIAYIYARTGWNVSRSE